MNTVNLLEYKTFLFMCPHCSSDGSFDIKTGAELGGSYAVDDFREVRFISAKCDNCLHNTKMRFLSEDGVKSVVEDWAIKSSKNYSISLPDDAPIIVNYGGGVDSTAMLIALVSSGIRPDIILFADTGGEKESTYNYIEYFNSYLEANNFPQITKVKYKPTYAPYDTLEGNCFKNQTLPSIAFRSKKNCSLKFKGKVMDDYLLGKAGINKCDGIPDVLQSLERGIKPIKLIGYDNGKADSRRAVKTLEDANFRFEHPLRQLKWAREDCILTILGAGLAVPQKSACFFCPSSKKWELLYLAAQEPEKLLRAVSMEDAARDGKHGLTSINGLWGHDVSWRNWLESEGIIRDNEIAMTKDKLIRLYKELKPQHESSRIAFSA
jgi:hypothetical protein